MINVDSPWFPLIVFWGIAAIAGLFIKKENKEVSK